MMLFQLFKTSKVGFLSWKLSSYCHPKIQASKVTYFYHMLKKRFNVKLIN